jgi:small subunit ribosomal protein S16e
MKTIQAGKGLVKVNGKPLNLVQPEILRFKVHALH